MKRSITILSIAAALFICMASLAFASEEGSSVLMLPGGSDTSLQIKPIEKEGVRHLFLPAGATNENLILEEGDQISDYEVMTDEKIGSLHFYSDDPDNKGMAFIHRSKDHSAKAPGRIVLLDENGCVEYEGAVDAIKGRGNSTWKTPAKKPYQIKLSRKADLLNPAKGAQKAKKWILLADAFDTSLIRNDIAYSLAREMGLESTPEGKHVDLYYDGKYRGMYYLCEKVEIGKGRIEINDMEDHPEITTGGYLLELDRIYFKSEQAFFVDKVAGPVVCKSPEKPTDQQLAYIEDVVGEAMQCISNGGISPDGDKALFDYFDKNSLVRFFLVNEWAVNGDAYLSSTYMYKPEDSDKLFMGPIWDFDHSMGKKSTKDAYRTWVVPYLAGNLIRIPAFRQALQDEYVNNMRPLIMDTLLGETSRTNLRTFTEIAGQVSTAAVMNHEAWTLMARGEGVRYYSSEIEKLHQWLSLRASWFDAAITDEDFVQVGIGFPRGDGKENAGHGSSAPVAGNGVSQSLNDGSRAPVSLVPPRPKMKIRAKKKSLVVSWKRAKNASCYQIRYYQENKKDRTCRNRKTKGGRITLKKLKGKTRYVVQVRACRKVKGKVYYSSWTTKAVKTG